MKFSTKETLSYCGQLAHSQRRDWFLASLYVPAPACEALYALYALDVELSHVHHAVSEEMIGHIRYAWWAERVESLSSGQIPQGHPLFEALAAQKLPAELLLPLVEHYREHFPQMPPHANIFTQNAARQLIETRAPKHIKKWGKATACINKHRANHGAGRESWLLVKLLFV